MIRSVCTLLIAVSWVLIASPISLAAPGEGVDSRDLFGVDSSQGAEPADPPPTEVEEEPAPIGSPRRGINPSGAGPGVQVRTGLSPDEVKRAPTAAELAAQEAEERAYREQMEREAWQNAAMLFVGVVLFVLVLGGMAFAVYAMVFQKRERDDTDGPASADAYDHLVQRDPTPAPVPPAAPTGSSPDASEFLSGQPTPEPVPPRDAASFTPVSVPGRPAVVDTPASVPGRVGGSMASSAQARPLLAPTATPAPMLRPAKPHAPTPPGYVPPRRPAPATPRPPSPAPSAVSGHVDGTYVSYGNPVPLYKTERSETPAPTRSTGSELGAPRAELPPEPLNTPVPSFTSTPDGVTETPAPSSRSRSATPPPMPWRKG